MMLRRMLPLVLLATLPFAACSRRQPPGTEPVALPDTAGLGARAAEPDRPRQDVTDDAQRRAEEVTARARAILEEIVHFDYDDSTLRPDAQEALARKVPLLRANPDVRLRVAGHADERGSVEYNLALGMRRANAVRDYLVGFGIADDRFDTISMGEDMPLDPRSNEQAWALNRRAEFSIAAGGATLVVPGS